MLISFTAERASWSACTCSAISATSRELGRRSLALFSTRTPTEVPSMTHEHI